MQENNFFYFDNAATTPLDPKVAKLIHEINLSYFGNPSSIHRKGQQAHNIIEKSRKSIAKLLNCKSSEIYFTSGGSESNNIILRGILKPGDHFITSSYEHPAILNLIDFLKSKNIKVTLIKPEPNGYINPKKIEQNIKSNTKLVSIMYVNNEIGTINPINEIGTFLKTKNIYFHTDAVQLIGKRSFDFSNEEVDFISIGAHKFYGPKGVGLLYIKSGTKVFPLIIGGGQESGIRAGTENISGIAGMSLALEIAYQNLAKNIENIKELETMFLKELSKHNIHYRVNGENRIQGILNLTFFGVDSHSLVINLDMVNIAISAGSACSSGSINIPKTLLEIGMNPDEAKNTVRISIGKLTNKNDIKHLAQSIAEIINRIKL
tara:strand:- start:1682 stop:2812 length:1131 start_codon:yes stop_codon:yes gene_type:complete